MVGPVSRGRPKGVKLILAVALGAQAAAAGEAVAETNVTVSCPELSAEERAQVEARVRANLLSAGLAPATVDLSCEATAAQTQVTGNGHQVTRRTERGASSIKEALLTSADSALSTWSEEAAEPSTPAMPAPALEPASSPTAPTPTPTPNRIPDERPTPRAISQSTWLWAGARGELWSNGSGLGGQLGVEQKRNSGFVAVHAGYLLSLPPSTRFSAHDLQFGAQIGWQPQGLLGLRGALGVGLSLFAASPAPGVRAQSDTSSTLPCLSVELSRPFEFGAVALLPALGLRAFTRSRAVLIDGERMLALPALAPEASLSLALKVGG